PSRTAPHHSPSLLPTPRPPSSTLFPYTTLFRSPRHCQLGAASLTLARSWRSTGSPFPASATTDRRGSKARRTSICWWARTARGRSEEHTSELQSRENLVCRLLLEKKKKREENTD